MSPETKNIWYFCHLWSSDVFTLLSKFIENRALYKDFTARWISRGLDELIPKLRYFDIRARFWSLSPIS